MRWKQKKREKEGLPKPEATLEKVPDIGGDQSLALPMRKYEKMKKKKKVQCNGRSLTSMALFFVQQLVFGVSSVHDCSISLQGDPSHW